LSGTDLEEELELLGRNVDLARRPVDDAELDVLVRKKAGHGIALLGLSDQPSHLLRNRRGSLGEHNLIEESEGAVAPAEEFCDDTGSIAIPLGRDDMTVAKRQAQTRAAGFRIERSAVRAAEKDEQFLCGKVLKTSLQYDAHARSLAAAITSASAVGSRRRDDVVLPATP